MSLRNFIIRVSVTYIVLNAITLLPGVQFGDGLFGVWLASLVFVLLTLLLRPLIIALALPFVIMSGGLALFVIDGVLLLLTDAATSMEIAGFGWAVLASIVMSIMNIWVTSAFKRLGWMETDPDDPPPIETPGPVLRVLLGLGLLFGLAFALVQSFQLVLALSTIIDNLRLILALAFVVLLLFSAGIAWLVAEGYSMERRAVFSVAVALLTGVGTLVTVALTVLRPVTVEPVELQTEYDLQSWLLPTGSEISYTYFPGAIEEDTPPIVFLHGGPGWAVSDADRVFYGALADEGFDVILYDRVGTGFSGALPRIKHYDMERDIADLDAIRQALDTDDMILIGHHFGAELAIRYLARYPERVARVVLMTPTPYTADQTFFLDYTRTGAPLGPLPIVEPRPLLASVIAVYGPDAAQRLMTEQQMSAWVEENWNPAFLTCAGTPAPQGPFGLDYYITLRVDARAADLPDPTPLLENNITPAVILGSECDFYPWEVVLQYHDALPNDRLYYIEDAGSAVTFEQPDAAYDIIRPFLHGEPIPARPLIGRSNPRPLLPDGVGPG